MMRNTIPTLSLIATACCTLALAGCSSNTAVGETKVRLLVEEPKDEKPAKDKKEAGEPFKFPADRGGQLLEKVLPPQNKLGTLNRVDRPAQPTVPAPRFAEPTTSLSSGTAVVMRVPSPGRKDVLRPRLIVGETFEGTPTAPTPPQEPSFDAGKPVAVPSPDVSIPAPLPVMAQATVDRIPVDDYTIETSTANVLSASLPRREVPAAFSKSGVPEPFENRKPLMTKVPEEQSNPMSGGPEIPK